MGGSLVKRLRKRDHWFAEWWSSMLLISVGIYGFCAPDHFIIQQSFIDGFVKVIPIYLWESLFIIVGLFQCCALNCESLLGRGLAAFFASSLLIWGTLNIAIYGQWHFSLLAWGIFSAINLYALSRILRGLEKNYESL
ncbi:hypothetical protein [Commensalibacter papalotli (ex Botero et al. 2024)]|uniref:Uncharacterized protein n=1 Tax=Commensalibacter papalotli (ex Botero et al. 2024) TaxID=2972766 RepID=A0ABM9HKQ6_9PROT|nr:hypothetical protein [Commensalibacter papalotli (ex Botero et al. 2024)]CAI3931709.1 unnamed protein product [Commensalibacter papalotli (ex Botero et al. 2024)]CAI3946986.1 unnamed protein product [Commensalibacter papalotli (ex Botero et al. 2024)]